jgi:Uma2 family endonuclease
MEPERYRFTADQVLAMIAAGVLQGAEDYELLDGELIHVTAKGPLHRWIAKSLYDRLLPLLPDTFHVQKEESVRGHEWSLPEPDVAVIRGRARDFRDQLPEGRDVVVAIEVSVTTLAEDRKKLAIYARAGVPAVWILDVMGRTLEIYTDNRGDRYDGRLILTDREAVAMPVIGEHWTVASLID